MNDNFPPDEENGTEIAGRVQSEGSGSIATILREIAAQMPLTSFPIHTRDGKVAAYNAVQSEDISLSECLEAEIEVSHYIIYAASMLDPETGLAKSIIRCSLISPDGTVYGGASEGIVGSLRSIVQIFGHGPWDPPIKLAAVERKSRNSGRRFQALKIVP